MSEFAVAVGRSCHREGVASLVGVHALRGVHRTDGTEGVETQTGASVDCVLRTEFLIVVFGVATRLG